MERSWGIYKNKKELLYICSRNEKRDREMKRSWEFIGGVILTHETGSKLCLKDEFLERTTVKVLKLKDDFGVSRKVVSGD